jgi:peptidoglycan hydrolase-like protein with peptidoglycan-binding domain
MRLCGRILSTGMQGDDVRQLHDALERLDLFVSAHERRSALFGPSTKKVVMDLQREHFTFASRVKGIVDQATANMINEELGRNVA